jgi:hypothetical protein
MPANEPNPPPAPHGQTNLDRRMEALLGDSLPKHFGSGWWSGVFGVLLGLPHAALRTCLALRRSVHRRPPAT